MKFKKRSKKYWVERTDKRMELAHRNANEVTAEVSKAYDKAIEQINKDMDSILTNFSKLDGMTKDEAIKLLNERISPKKLEEIRAEIKTLPDGPIKTQLINKINAQAYRARMTRKQALKEKLQIECSKVASTELEASRKFYTKQIKETYYRNMFDFSQGVGQAIDFTLVPKKRIDAILEANWSGKHYSKRIWGNCEAFAEKLEELILKGAMEGKNSTVLARELREYANVGKHVSERLLRTETTYIATMADLEAMKDRDTEELEFVATLDGRTSRKCQEHDGNRVKVSKAEPGKNVPPLHTYCRSTMIEVMDDLEHKVRWARDKSGKPIQVPGDMKYPEFKEKFLEKSGKNDIIKSEDKTYMIKSPIEHKNTGKGNPNAITMIGRPLNNRQEKLLHQLSNYDERVIVKKSYVSMVDLAALTAQTGVEFAMFTKGVERLIIRGNEVSVNVTLDIAKKLKEDGYKWSGHTHPGNNDFALLASDGDVQILKEFDQQYGVIYDSRGRFSIFEGGDNSET